MPSPLPQPAPLRLTGSAPRALALGALAAGVALAALAPFAAAAAMPDRDLALLPEHVSAVPAPESAPEADPAPRAAPGAAPTPQSTPTACTCDPDPVRQYLTADAVFAARVVAVTVDQEARRRLTTLDVTREFKCSAPARVVLVERWPDAGGCAGFAPSPGTLVLVYGYTGEDGTWWTRGACGGTRAVSAEALAAFRPPSRAALLSAARGEPRERGEVCGPEVRRALRRADRAVESGRFAEAAEAYRQAAADRSTTDRSTTDRSTTDRSTTDRSTTDRSTTDRSTTDRSITDRPTTEPSPARQPHLLRAARTADQLWRLHAVGMDAAERGRLELAVNRLDRITAARLPGAPVHPQDEALRRVVVELAFAEARARLDAGEHAGAARALAVARRLAPDRNDGADVAEALHDHAEGLYMEAAFASQIPHLRKRARTQLREVLRITPSGSEFNEKAREVLRWLDSDPKDRGRHPAPGLPLARPPE